MGMMLYNRRFGTLKHTSTAQRQMEMREKESAAKRLDELGHTKKKGRRSKAEVAEQARLAKVVNGAD